MKLCYITDLYPPEDKGGAERIAYYEAKMMADKGHEVVVITSTRKNIKNPRGYKVEKKEGIKVYYFSPVKNFKINPYEKNASFLKKAILMVLSLYNPYSYSILKLILEKENPDIVHAHYIYFISYGALRAVNLNRSKLIITFHVYHYECPKGGLLRKGLLRENLRVCKSPPLICKLRNYLFKIIMPDFSAIIAISKYIKYRLEKKRYSNVIYLPNGVALPEEKKKRFKIYPDILFVGRLTKAKGIQLLIESFNVLRPQGFTLRIIGDGEDRKYFERIAKNNKNIVFMGKIPHEKLFDYYNKSYLVVVPSIWYEGMNTVVCEAMAYGKSIIASDVPGHRDMILNGETGILFKMGDINELTNALKKLIQNENLTQKMGGKAKKRIKIFSEQKHFEKLLNLYNTILNQQKS